MADIIAVPFKSDHLCFMNRSIVITEDIVPIGDDTDHKRNLSKNSGAF